MEMNTIRSKLTFTNVLMAALTIGMLLCAAGIGLTWQQGVGSAVTNEPREVLLTITEKSDQDYIVFDDAGNCWQVWEKQVYWNIPEDKPFHAVIRNSLLPESPYAGVIDAVLVENRKVDDV